AAEGERAAYLAAYTALELKDYRAAYRLAQDFLNRHRQHELRADAQLVAAEAAGKLGKRDRAIELYTNLLQSSASDPRAAQWRLRLSAMHRDAGQWEAAARVLEDSADSLPTAERQDALLQLAEGEKAAGDTQACLGTLARLLALKPTGNPLARALYLRGEVLTELGKTAEANADFTRLAQSLPQHELAPFALYALASNQSTAGDASQVEHTLKNLLANYQAGPLGQARFLYANVLYQNKQYDAALRELAQAEAPEPDKTFLVGMVRAGKQEDRDALKAFDGLIAQFPRHKLAPQALYESAWLLRKPNPQDAIKRFQRVTTEYADSPLTAEAALRAGELLYEASQPQDAIAWLAKAAQAPSVSPEVKAQALHLAGWAQYDLKRYKPALAAFDQQLATLRSGPLTTDALRMRGECFFALEQYADALRAYNEPAAAPGENGLPSLQSLAALHAGQAAAQAGNWDESLKWLDQALESDDTNREQAQYERAWALANLKRTNEAKQLFAQLADTSGSPLAARSRFMLGEMQFAHKQYEAAVRTFFRVAYGYGGREAPQEYHAWQSESLFEAARCLEELDRKEPAKKLYLELLERFPESPKARHARTRLQSGVLR
ncbi:MAG: tetratricopeptide repeat protein, partial [Planctomycetales bacterium]|nr:tetratricopeptide repeat protein [Planctomycetales bacterium]